MKFCPVVPEICRGQVRASRKERIRIMIIIIIIIIIIIKIKIIIRNGAKTISPPNFVY
jgi:t-SNARE complex subunit (syntaxin)